MRGAIEVTNPGISVFPRRATESQVVVAATGNELVRGMTEGADMRDVSCR